MTMLHFLRDPDMQKRSRDFSVDITYDPESGYWTAVCEALGIVTEAENYEALTARVWTVAPEMYELCGYGTANDNFCLTFRQTQEARLHEAL